MTKEEKRALNPEIVFVSRELGVPKKWLWYLIENDLETFVDMANFAEECSESVMMVSQDIHENLCCKLTYASLRKLTDDIKWIADAYKTDKRKPFPAEAFEKYYLKTLAEEKEANDGK